MNRALTYLLGPEAAMALLTALIFFLCARYGSYSSRDVDIINNLIWSLPLVTVVLAYATIFVPGARSWWWIPRVNIAVAVALLICVNKLSYAHAAPDSGPRSGMEYVVVLCFGLCLAALANAIAGALILAEHKPAFAAWFRAHRVIGSVLTVLAAVPVGFAMSLGFGLLAGSVVFFSTLFKR